MRFDDSDLVVRITLFLLGMLFLTINTTAYGTLNNFISLYVVLLSAYCAWWSRKRVSMTILFLLLTYCNYCIAFSEYVNIISNTIFTTYANTKVATTGINIMLLFWCVLVLFLPTRDFLISNVRRDEGNLWSSKIEFGGMKYFVLAIDLVLILIFIFAYARPEILGDSRGSPSALYEYSIIFFIISFYFGQKFLETKWITIFLLLLFSGQNFIFGGRITGVQLLIVLYIMCYSYKISIKKIAPLILIGFLLLNIIGATRESWIYGNISLTDIINRLTENYFTLDTVYSSYHTSLTFVLSEDIAEPNERLGLFIGFLKSIITGGYGNISNSASSYSRQFFLHYGGGTLPFFFHFYLGWGGVVLISIMLPLLIKKLLKNFHLNGITKCVLVYLVCSTFRWYLYSPIQLTRGILLMVFSYVFFCICVYLIAHYNLKELIRGDSVTKKAEKFYL